MQQLQIQTQYHDLPKPRPKPIQRPKPAPEPPRPRRENLTNAYNEKIQMPIIRKIYDAIIAAGLPDPKSKSRLFEYSNSKALFFFMASVEKCDISKAARFLGYDHATGLSQRNKALNVLKNPKTNPVLYELLTRIIA